MKPLLVLCLAAAGLLATVRGVVAIEERRTGIANCVSHDWIHFGSEDQSAVLDEADHRLVRAEMIRRYPVIQGDGFPVSRSILWQKQTGELLYIAVIENPANPSQACFTATFSAEKFDLTLPLRRKYLVPPGPGK